MARTSPARVTAHDVAREAGVSQATVSYVFNGTRNQTISEATTRRVQEAAERLGYVPFEAARTLRSGRSTLVLALIPDWPIGHVVDRMLASLAQELSKRGLLLMMHRSHTAEQRMSIVRGVKPAAIVAFERLDATEINSLRAHGVIIGTALLDPDHPSSADILTLPQGRIGHLQVDYLKSRGHLRLGYATPSDARLSGYAEQRLGAVTAACAELGLAAPAVHTVDLDPGSLAKAVHAWTTAPATVTAVCAYNDEIAVGLVAAARRAGVRVPEDLAVIGVDDIPLAASIEVPLTTVRVDAAVLAAAIHDLIVPDSGAPATDPDSAVQLVVRESA